MTGIPAELREFMDKYTCTELVYKLARSIDRMDSDLLGSVFHEDATDDHGMFIGTAKDFIPWVMSVLGDMNRTQHCICNVLIDLQGDTAYGESYFIAHHHIPNAGAKDTFLVAGGRYLDRFERRNGVWKIAHRHCAFDWNTNVESTDDFDRANLAGYEFGVQNASDASYKNFKGNLGPGLDREAISQFVMHQREK